MKRWLSVLVLVLGCGLGASFGEAGAGAETKVRFSVVPFSFAVSAVADAEVYRVSEVRVLANFNNWGNGGFDFFRVWEGSLPLEWNEQDRAFEADVSLVSGSSAEFTFVIKAEGSWGTRWQGWYDPYRMRTPTGAFFFSPISSFVDNRVGNGGHNALFVVP